MKRLSVKKLTKIFSDKKTSTLVLDNLNFEVFDNEITVILGQSGCGKTTLLNLIAGFISPTMGTITLNNQEVKKSTEDLGVIFQEPQLFPWLTVEKNIRFGPNIKAEPINLNRLITLTNLKSFENYYPSMLSRGMQQKVALARALAIKPKFLLMDEPFSSLDTLTKQKMQELILNIHNETKIPIVFITHDIEEALFLSNKILVMTKRPGKIKAIISNPLPKKRNNEIKYTKEFLNLKKQIEQMLVEEN